VGLDASWPRCADPTAERRPGRESSPPESWSIAYEPPTVLNRGVAVERADSLAFISVDRGRKICDFGSSARSRAGASAAAPRAIQGK
jgi:hypothetical protein